MDEHQGVSSAVAVKRKLPDTLEAPLRAANPRITIAAIIPLYNGAPFIREALESVLAQTEPADEIIVVDDGSTDNGAGAAIVREMAAKHPIRLMTKTNGGQGSARNLGIASSGCTHIALLDQDDIWYEDHLEILKRPFLKGHREDLGLVYGNMDRIDRAGRMIRRNFLDEVPAPHPKTSLLQCLGHDMFILPGASLFTKAAWEKAGRFDERLAGYEDDDLFIRMFSAGIDFVFLKDQAVYKWRIYTDSTSYSPRMAKSRMIYFRKLVEQYPDEPKLNQRWTQDVIGPRFLHILYCEYIDASRQGDFPRMTRAWSDIQEVLPVMPSRNRRRMAVARPLINTLSSGPLRPLARSLLRRAIKRKR